MGLLKPDYIYDRVTDIPKKTFQGKKLLIFDIDNTLFYPGTTEIPKEILTWFKKIPKKYKVLCFSNSLNIVSRKKEIEKKLGKQVVLSRHKKPSKKVFTAIQAVENIPAEQSVMVGDRLFTDILFGNRIGATTVLCKKRLGKGFLLTQVARFFERVILFLRQ